MEYSTKNLIFKQFFKRNLYRKVIVSLLAIYRGILGLMPERTEQGVYSFHSRGNSCQSTVLTRLKVY